MSVLAISQALTQKIINRGTSTTSLLIAKMLGSGLDVPAGTKRRWCMDRATKHIHRVHVS